MYLLRFLSLCTLFLVYEARIHRLKIEKDDRPYISLSSFGYYPHGYLKMNISHFSFLPPEDKYMFGFTVEKILNSAGYPDNMEMYRDRCLLYDEQSVIEEHKDVIFFVMDFPNKLLRINCSAESNVSRLQIFTNLSSLPVTTLEKLAIIGYHEEPIVSETNIPQKTSCANNLTIPLNLTGQGYTTQFVLYIPSENEQGQYISVFHSCENYKAEHRVLSSFSMNIVEHNVDNYLSAGEVHLPDLYFIMAVLFLIAALSWIYILLNSRHPVYSIHYLMGLLVILKSMGLLFHGIYFSEIQKTGEHETAWAILYYVVHLLRGSVLFTTIILIGTGWTFIKHILSPKDKKIFIIVIPLQVLANIAEIILDESEQGDTEHNVSLQVFTFVDLACCFAILFPIVWSIKHLQDASHTDGKAAINLKKLKLFRHFYIMIICYIYVTRIIVFLIKMTISFQYEWVDEMFKETATLIFFVLTGYKFRPASANPYFNVPENDETDMEIFIRKCGFTEGLTKLSRISNDFGDDDKDSLLIFKRESSHDYD